MLEWLIGSSKAFTSWSVHHDNHHKVPKCNHEPFFTYLDRWFGTLYLEEGSSSSSKLEETPQAQPQPPLPTLDIADVTPVPPEDGKPTESLLCHTADTFAAAVVSRLGRSATPPAGGGGRVNRPQRAPHRSVRPGSTASLRSDASKAAFARRDGEVRTVLQGRRGG